MGAKTVLLYLEVVAEEGDEEGDEEEEKKVITGRRPFLATIAFSPCVRRRGCRRGECSSGPWNSRSRTLGKRERER